MENFDIDKLTYLANHHKNLRSILKDKITNGQVGSNKLLYLLINDYYLSNNLSKAFPIGISVNNIIAHDSYHPNHIINFKLGDFIKVDFGIELDGNIIDCARTWEYGVIMEAKSIGDCREIVESIEQYIEKEIEKNKKILVQKISIYTNLLITQKGYNTLDFLGGHNIEKGCVHGKKLILNKPAHLLPKGAEQFVNKTDELGEGEMFAIEVYIPNVKSNGTMIQNVKIPLTHYELNRDIDKMILKKNEMDVYNGINKFSNNLPYEYHLHDKFDKKIIKSLLEKNAILKHYPLEWIDNQQNIKYVQYEDTFIIKDFKLLNLSK
jgi:methionine aminopeptidase